MARTSTMKNYRLMRGDHDLPNPEYNPTDPTGESKSHVRVLAGALVPLTDAQYEAFKDKFAPAESAASDVKTEEDSKLTTAAQQATMTGRSQNPNTGKAL